MDVFTMVVAIVAVSCGAGVINTWLKTNRKVDRSELNARLEARLGDFRKLEQRIAVLERIVTDKHYDLKKELHELESE
ncbi:MAG: hypothetical protein KJO54_10130 [Gammaproteobacteria bacterium]|nr:hypothetical protein [Gammaproteobacteria bacterium]NNF62316.1 hypothetical protein [Gammaproteobacteria bacterium]NNM20880.1 hypothetical protein [Gammaproteobacteria bacterium]